MSERGVAEIRREIEAERQALTADLDAIKTEARALVPVVAAALTLIALVTFRKGVRSGVKLLWRLV